MMKPNVIGHCTQPNYGWHLSTAVACVWVWASKCFVFIWLLNCAVCFCHTNDFYGKRFRRSQPSEPCSTIHYFFVHQRSMKWNENSRATVKNIFKVFRVRIITIKSGNKIENKQSKWERKAVSLLNFVISPINFHLKYIVCNWERSLRIVLLSQFCCARKLN